MGEEQGLKLGLHFKVFFTCPRNVNKFWLYFLLKEEYYDWRHKLRTQLIRSNASLCGMNFLLKEEYCNWRLKLRTGKVYPFFFSVAKKQCFSLWDERYM